MSLGFFIGILFFLIGAFFLQGLRIIPADPPHIAVRTVWGERKENKKLLKEGWHFFPIYPFWHGFIMEDITKKNMDLPAQSLRLPDQTEIEAPVSVTFTPDEKDTKCTIAYLNSGGEKGVRTILSDIIRETLREWGINKDEGPQTYMEALGSSEEATAILLKAILGSELKEIPSSVPTAILLKYYNEPQKKPTESQKIKWENNWEKVEEIIDRECQTDEEKKELKKAVEFRRAEIRNARRGNGEYKKPQLGIILNRLNLGEMKPKGRLAEVMELEVVEKREKDKEIVELNHVEERIQKLIAEPLNLSKEQALEIVQTERNKVTKNVQEFKMNLSDSTRKLVEKLGSDLILKIVQSGGSND